ncbi:MAG: tol-pal system-associated acyl-CoA thioesterase [Pseudomonadota bacterium]
MAEHELKIRVYFEDTDAGGVVYHASYIRFAERGRTEMLREAGFEHARLFKETGVCFAVVSMQIDYNAPARLDDLLVVRSSITRLGGASMEMQQDIADGDRLLVRMKVTLVCIDSKFKAVRLPAEIRKIFEGI